MKCEDCLYEKICYMREISNDIKEEIKEFGCMNFIACADVREVKDVWRPTKDGLGMRHMFEELNRLYGDEFIKYK